jgi:threonine/homoserine/homoserine lactone efflux protein
MTITNVLLGLAIGLPVMIAVGPISLLLLDQGLERGPLVAAPAALGVAAADLTFATGAALAGASVTALLAPMTGWLTVAALALLAWLAVNLARSAVADLRSPHRVAAPVGAVAASPSPLGQLRGPRLAGAFYGLTMVNPLTIVLFASIVIAGGPGVGTAGWAIGMALASLVAHAAFVVVGGVLGARLGPSATARLRLGAAVLMGALAVHLGLAG